MTEMEEVLAKVHPYRYVTEGAVCAVDRILRAVVKGKMPDLEDLGATHFLPAQYDEETGDYNLYAIFNGIALEIRVYKLGGVTWHANITHTSQYFDDVKDCIEGDGDKLYRFLVDDK